MCSLQDHKGHIMEHITLDFINQFKDQLLKMSTMSEDTITRLWGLCDFNYYLHFADKFLVNRKSPFAFCKDCDPGNQQKLLGYYSISSKREKELIEFFAWIKNGLCIIDLKNLEDPDVSPDNLCELIQQNEIIFFYGISDSSKQRLINKYNKEHVDRYNSFIKSKK